ncbi:hypothetical protein PSHT_11102 [Puccinia striiformis]|uniref:Uncharacterized protein n=1 Tax=Puccinia striiformis TaxID=27350 RepID=A0A2S4V5D8_9BASI|nr:hypothetical protein PSHT_11102 [Puccinia striiformis]
MVSSAPSPQGTPSRPPSRQSTRIITPSQTDPNFIRPNKDSRKSLTAISRTSSVQTNNKDSEDPDSDTESNVAVNLKRPCPKRPAPPTKPTNKQKRSTAGSQPTSNTAASQDIMDITQDSDEENTKVKKKHKPRAKKDAEHGIGDIAVYFHDPVFGEGESDSTQGKLVTH